MCIRFSYLRFWMLHVMACIILNIEVYITQISKEILRTWAITIHNIIKTFQKGSLKVLGIMTSFNSWGRVLRILMIRYNLQVDLGYLRYPIKSYFIKNNVVKLLKFDMSGDYLKRSWCSDKNFVRHLIIDFVLFIQNFSNCSSQIKSFFQRIHHTC